MRYAARRDTVEAAIIEALERTGCQVLRISQPGVADLLVKRVDGQLFLLECKGRRGRLTPAQQRWMTAWGDVPVVRTPAEALEAVGANRLWIAFYREMDTINSSSPTTGG